MTERVLVTGAAGFIGSHVCEALLENGNRVVGLDAFDPFYPRDVKEQWLGPLLRCSGFAFVEADVREAPRLANELSAVDAVVHLAARPGVRQSMRDPWVYADINVGGTVAILDAALQAGVSRFVLASSSSVYGDSEDLPFREDAAALLPTSPYGASKRAAELFCQAIARTQSLTIALLRLFSVYGPRQRPDQAVARLTKQLRAGEAVERYGDGSSERDHTHVDDVVQGVLAAVRWTRQGGSHCEIFNLGTGRAVPLTRLIELVADAVGRNPVVCERPWQSGDAARTRADISKAKEILGYHPNIALEDGIPAFVAWYEDTYGR